MRRGGWSTLAAVAALLLSAATAAAEMLLPPKGGYDPQLGGAYAPPPGVVSVSRDRLEKPAPGIYSICYINAFQTQAEETGWWRQHHGGLLLTRPDGTPVEDDNWPGEYFLDTSSAARREAIFAIQAAWVGRCAEAGFAAIELDNFDSWTRSGDLLTLADNLGLARLLSDHAHGLGLAVAQKNNAEIGAEGRILGGFDFVIAEDCEAFEECEAFIAVYGDKVIEVEYADDDPQAFERACAKRKGQIPIVLRDRLLTTPGDKDYKFDMC